MVKSDIFSVVNHELAQWAYSFGGKAANAAVYCSAAGATVAFMGTVGNDFDQIGYRAYMQEFDIDIDDVFDTGEKTPVYIALSYKGKTY
jgi:sugar/nucleoside kinase (ribokinase family)